MTVVWTEFAIHVEAAFGAGPPTRDRLLAYATGTHARPELIAVLRSLPDRPYASIRDLWQELAHASAGG